MKKHFITLFVLLFIGTINALFAQNRIVAHKLSWDSASFKHWYKDNGKTKIMFEFEVSNELDLTLSGWAFTPDDDYSDYVPSINLNIITASTGVSIPNGTFLGNIKLKGPLVEKIYNKITNYQFIIFKPEIDDDNHLIYVLYLALSENTLDKDLVRIAKTDPSPPATSR